MNPDWKIVPLAPTQDMLHAGYAIEREHRMAAAGRPQLLGPPLSGPRSQGEVYAQRWRAMVEAAPAAPEDALVAVAAESEPVRAQAREREREREAKREAKEQAESRDAQHRAMFGCQERIAAALERIATALEAANAANSPARTQPK